MAIREIRPTEVPGMLAAGVPLIDVRTPGEFAALHATEAQNIPLDLLEQTKLHEIAPAGRALFICQGGNRSKKACEQLSALPNFEAYSVIGGTAAWSAAGLPTIKGHGVISLERQVRIVAGLLVLLGTILGLTVHRYFLGVPLFVGAGLIFAGVTDFCGMAMMLARLPWNRSCTASCSRS